MISTDNSTTDQAIGKTNSCTLGNLKIFYTNCDQFLNKRDDLLMCIADKPPGIILLVEVIPKAQVALIDQFRLALPGYNAYFNFDPTFVVQALVVLQYLSIVELMLINFTM